MSLGIIGYKARIWKGDGATPEVFTPAPEVVSIDPADPQFDEAEFTHLESPNRRKEFKPTFSDGGEVKVEENYIPGDSFQQGVQTDRDAGTIRNFKISWADNETGAILRAVIFPGYVKSAKPGNTTTKERVPFNWTVRVTGAETWS